ncbi:DNA polymerase zeta [Cryomyces antarcticus]|nr:DNA polymerase zeta [Cryomyces antarcticus]
MAGLWRDETRRRKMRMGINDPSSSPFPPEVMVSMSADPRNTERGGWIHEEEYRQLVEELVKEEGKSNDGHKLGFDSFVKPHPMEAGIKTTLESVEDLFPENLQSFVAPLDGAAEKLPIEGKIDNEDVVVDVTNVLKFDGEESPYESDEETAKEIAMTQAKRKTEHISKETLAGRPAKIAGEDKLRRDGDSDSHQFLNPGDHASPDTPGRADSTYGSDIFDEDAFVIPQDRVDGPNIAKASDHLLPDIFQSHKRRKLSHTSQPPSIESGICNDRSKNPLDDECPQPRCIAIQGNSVDDQRSPLHTTSVAANVPRLAVNGSTMSSQRRLKAQGMGGNSTLTFPVTSPSSRQAAIPAQVLEAVCQLSSSFDLEKTAVFCFGSVPPSAEEITSTMLEAGIPPIIYQDAYYSEEKDVPERPREYGGREFKLGSTTMPYLPTFDSTGMSAASIGQKPSALLDKAKEDLGYQRRRRACTLRNWEIAVAPPSRADVETWILQEEHEDSPGDIGEVDIGVTAQQRGKPKQTAELSQIEGPTQKNKGFKYSKRQDSTSVQHEIQYMSTMSLEIHVNTRGDLAPDPAEDAIACIFWCIQTNDEDLDSNGRIKGTHVGILALSEPGGLAQKIRKQVSVEVEEEDNELDLLNRMIDIVRAHDPDILTGYEVHNSSWGYLMERARLKYEFNLCDEFSRMISQSHGRFGKEADRWGFTQTSTIRITGRHMINIWRAMRGELNLLQYTMENVVFHLLHRRIPHYPFASLTRWYQKGTNSGKSKPRDLAKVLDYFIDRVQLDLEILEANELIARTSEQARLLGVDFFSVFSRGSQYKVESLMFRIAKAEMYVLVSPSRKQVGRQNALECLPLVMEPQSAFYNSPLLVLDFQSLYPSVMIAYNYCYSTCLGRIVSWRGQNKMGFTDFQRSPRLLELVKDNINIAPNGMMYVKPEMRKSLLAKMLGEILETRVMVKSGMKVDKDDKTLQQLLNNRQLALKLIANVTYGYTSASFSGRMPCSEIADSIVQTGRETLEKTIALIHSVERWGAEVVYGDTDSLFVYLKGRTNDQAFTIGEEIAKAVTDTNPRPIKLKFEKVYHPCVLLAKKRYVGFKYEHRDQKEPEFDAKGIETVRRDGTPAEQKIEEKALKILFRTADLSQVKAYFQRQCTKIMTGKFSIQDFCFAKEVKLGTYSDRGPPPPGALIATKRMLNDPRLEPQYGERVPYVVITGAPGARLFERCVEPERLLNDEHAELDAEYYISKNLIPPLERIFNLVGANVRQWYDETPKVQRVRTLASAGRAQLAPNGQALFRKTMESYMQSSACLVCRTKLPPIPANATEVQIALCANCRASTSRALLALRSRLKGAEEKKRAIDTVCRSCANLAWDEEIKCDSRDCPIFYSRVKATSKLGSVKTSVGSAVEALEKEFGGREGIFEW